MKVSQLHSSIKKEDTIKISTLFNAIRGKEFQSNEITPRAHETHDINYTLEQMLIPKVKIEVEADDIRIKSKTTTSPSLCFDNNSFIQHFFGFTRNISGEDKEMLY